MSGDAVRHQEDARPTSDLHPVVYKGMIGLVLLFVLAVWDGFAGGSYTDFLLSVVTGLFVMALALPGILWRVGRKHDDRGTAETALGEFRDWASGEVDLGPGRVSGRTAAVEVLLPLAAVAFGMVAFAVIILSVNG